MGRSGLPGAGDKGFTLIEVLVALAVMAIVMGTLFKLQSSTVALAGAARFREAAVVLARQQLEALAASDYDPEEHEGTFDGIWAGYSWDCEVESGADAGDWEEMITEERAEDLKRVCLTVYSPEKERSFSMEVWRYAPVR